MSCSAHPTSNLCSLGLLACRFLAYRALGEAGTSQKTLVSRAARILPVTVHHSWWSFPIHPWSVQHRDPASNIHSSWRGNPHFLPLERVFYQLRKRDQGIRKAREGSVLILIPFENKFGIYRSAGQPLSNFKMHVCKLWVLLDEVQAQSGSSPHLMSPGVAWVPLAHEQVSEWQE